MSCVRLVSSIKLNSFPWTVWIFNKTIVFPFLWYSLWCHLA